MIDLEQLRSTRLAEPSESFLSDLGSRVAPVLGRRRRVRFLRNTSVAASAFIAASVVLMLFRGPIVWPFRMPAATISGSYQVIPIDTSLESSDVVIQGQVSRVDQSLESVSITFRILESHPAIPEASITVSAPGRGSLDKGRQYIVLLNRVNGVYTHPNASFGYPDYPIEDSATGPIVRNLVPGENDMPLARAWAFIRETYDRMHDTVPPSAESLAPFREALRQGTISEGRRAVEVLAQYPEIGLDEAELLAAIVNRHPSMRPLGNIRKSEFARFAGEVLKALTPIASEETARRMVELYLKDMSNLRDCSLDDSSFEVPLLRLAVKHPGSERAERVYQLLGKEIIYRDSKGNQQGRVVLMRPWFEILNVLVETPGEDMDAIIAAVYADPSRFHLEGDLLKHLQEAREQVELQREKLKQAPRVDADVRLKDDLRAAVAEGRGWMLTNLLLRIRTGDPSLVPIVKEADPLNYASIIRYKLPDPEFIPILRKSLDDERVLKSSLSTALYRTLSTLHACGDGEFSLAYARQTLTEAGGARGDWDASAKGNVMLFLGEFGGESDLAQIARFGDPATLNTFWRNLRKSGLVEADGSRFFPHPPAVDAGSWLELCSLLARTRLKDPSVVPELKARMESKDSGWRVASATALYFLEDEAGDPVVKLLREHAEDSDPSLMYSFGVFEWVVAYLQSPRMDALRLERLKNGFGPGEGDMVHDGGFLMRHGKEAIPLLVNHLESRDWWARTFARHSLQSITGIHVDWDEGAPASGNREAVAKLRAAADALVSEISTISTRAVETAR